MRMGNITISSKPRLDDFKIGICSSCLCECQEVGVDNSFSDLFGNVEDWGIGSECCDAEVYDGNIWLDKTSIHTARKDHKDGKVKAGQRYRQRIQKGYYMDEQGNHFGIFEITKRIIKG